MKVSKLMIIAVIIAFFATVSVALAEETVTGTVVKSEKGLVIESADGSYVLAGQDAAEMVGKKVKIVGTIAEGDEGKTLTIMSIEEVQE